MVPGEPWISMVDTNQYLHMLTITNSRSVHYFLHIYGKFYPFGTYELLISVQGKSKHNKIFFIKIF